MEMSEGVGDTYSNRDLQGWLRTVGVEGDPWVGNVQRHRGHAGKGSGVGDVPAP